MIDFLWLQATVATPAGNIVGPGLIARDFAQRLFGRDFEDVVKRGIIVELPDRGRPFTRDDIPLPIADVPG